IKWQENGFEIVGEALNCEEAIDVFKEKNPDIIITDIRMGEGNGLDLVAEIKELKPDVEFVIISGYEQFDYAKRALENGISAYLLKPIQNDELLKAMNNIKERLQKNDQICEIKAHIPTLKDNFIKFILTNKTNTIQNIEKNFALYNIEFPKNEYVVVKLCFDNYQSLTDKDSEIYDNLFNATINYTVKLYEYPLICENMGRCKYAFIISVDDEKVNKLEEFSVVDFLNSLKEQFRMVSQKTFSAGISTLYDNVVNINFAYDEAREAFKNKLKRGNDSIIKYSEITKCDETVVSISNDDIETMISCIKNVDYDGTLKVVNSFLEYIETLNNISVENIHNIVAEMFVMIMRSIFRENEDIVKVYGYVMQPFPEVQKYETIADIKAWTLASINKIFEDPNVYLECTYHPEIQQAIVIIMKDYMKPLTAESVASSLFISSYYLMHLFKKETGKTFNKFLTEHRIKVAVELIKTNKYKIYDICEMVGYKDPNYFTQIFKKFTGSTPSNFQQ
ncbi:MAG: response regulator, partial [Oscillospiraceae bacterium]